MLNKSRLLAGGMGTPTHRRNLWEGLVLLNSKEEAFYA